MQNNTIIIVENESYIIIRTKACRKSSLLLVGIGRGVGWAEDTS